MLAQTHVYAKPIQHPLDHDIANIVYKNLGHSKNWKDGDEIPMSRFNPIRNKSRVYRYLQERGFAIDRTSYDKFIFVDSQKTLKKIKRETEKLLNDRNTNTEYGEVHARQLIERDGFISNEKLDSKQKMRLAAAISHLRKKGFVIDAERNKGRAGRYTIYKLKNL